MPRTAVAEALATILPPQTRIEAYDGSAAGSADAEVVITVKSPRALSHMVSAPGQLGLARTRWTCTPPTTTSP
jgi:cyclopropane-fatty-acyl-phospholipid synthase